MTTKTLVALLAVSLVPVALAHVPAGAPNPACNASENPHDYVGAAETTAAGKGIGFLTVTDGCADVTSDGDFEFGYGGAFLPASHHSDTVCVTDNVVPYVSFLVGADVNGDGIISTATGDNLASGSGCVTAGFAAGADGGWWVFIQSPATSGHVSA